MIPSATESFQVIPDVLLSFSYFLLLLGLFHFVRSRRDLAYRPLFFILGLFLFFGGSAALAQLWAFGRGPDAVQSSLKFMAAVLSMAVAVLLWRTMRQALTLPNPMNLLPGIMQAVHEAKGFQAALQTALQKVCEAAAWDYAEVWVPTEDGKILECSQPWWGGPAYKDFREVSRELRFTPEIGLQGRVWAARKPEWVQNISDQRQPVFLRAQMAKEAGLQAALAVPVLVENRVLAVLIFMSRKARRSDLRIEGLAAAVAVQLSAVLDRDRMRRALHQSDEHVERRIQQRIEELTRENEVLLNEMAGFRRSEEALRRSQEVHQSLIHSIEAIVWEFDLAAGKFTFVSSQAERMLGYPAATWLGEPAFWQDHIHGGDREAALAFRARVAQEKTDDQIEYRMITADGHARWFRDMVTVVLENGQSVRLRGTMVDITDQKVVEEALNQERNYAAAVLDTAGALVLVLDRQGRIGRFNFTFEQISGRSDLELKGKYFWDLFEAAEEVEKMKTIFNRLLAGQFPINFESHWAAKDGTRYVIAWSNTVLFNRENVAVNIIATGIDITKRKEIEQKLKEAIVEMERSNQELDRSSRDLKEANERLLKLDELKSQFISAASHELKTPLTSMEGYLETILQGDTGPITDQQRQFLSYVKQSTDRLHRLLNELLDISKIEAGQVKMNKALTPVAELLKEEIMIFKAQADEKEIPLDLEIEGDLEPVYCDADKIREVMDNLISNAIKYTPRGGKIRISAAPREDGLAIEVYDTGIGIKAEDQSRIFEPFQSIPKENPDAADEESTGLGLTLVKKIVEAHKGRVSVKSEPGKGSVFSVLLPAGSSQIEKVTPWAVRYE